MNLNKMKRFDVITIGGATEDLIAMVDDYVMINNATDPLRTKLVAFEYGAKIGITDLHSGFGGGAINSALAFTRLGKKVAVHACLGEDERGDRILQNLLKHKIDTRFTLRHAGASGLSTIVKTAANDHVIFTYRGANDYLEIHSSLLRAMQKAKRVYVSSLTGPWRNALKKIMDSKANIAWNPGRVQLSAGYSVLKQFLEKTEILILNKDEATQLYVSQQGIKKGNYSIQQLLRALTKYGPRIVVITNAGKGASAMSNKTIYNQKSLSSKVVDTTGVGDAFAATFVASFDMHHDISRALLVAAKNAASVLTKAGPHHGLKTAAELHL